MSKRDLGYRIGLQQRPLALCLAVALGIGTASGTSAAGGVQSGALAAMPKLTRHRITNPADLPAGSKRRVAWEALLANPPPPRPAATIPVTNCNNSGAGSLRDAVSSAVDGDIIDMSALTCSTITLTTGALSTSADSLKLDGPDTSPLLTIDPGGHGAFLNHFGTGLLSLYHLDFENGYHIAHSHPGGCVFSNGTVSMVESVVRNCLVTGELYNDTYGGAIYAAGDVFLAYSTIASNELYSSYAFAIGGGVFTRGFFQAFHSTVEGNSASTDAYGGAYGGGVWANSGAQILYSTIADNYSSKNIGGIALPHLAAEARTLIINSTISGNSAQALVGGVYSTNPTLLYNSTIAFNEAGYSSAVNGAAGLDAPYTTLTMHSTIIANNIDHQVSDGPNSDLDAFDSTVGGANNLVRYAFVNVPPDTIVGTDPLLSSLAYNGGPTRTHALSPSSPAIDAGNNSYVFDGGYPVYWDQRGTGYSRVVGANADIGAFELGNTPDVIFANGFD